MSVAIIRNMDINEITYQIRGAVFEINRILGSGFLEKVYEKALIIELLVRGLRAESQVAIEVTYKGEVVGEYFPDIVVEDKVIIELKAVEQLQKIHEAQILNYLKATGYKVGLLINFMHPKAEIKRFDFYPQTHTDGHRLLAAPVKYVSLPLTCPSYRS